MYKNYVQGLYSKNRTVDSWSHLWYSNDPRSEGVSEGEMKVRAGTLDLAMWFDLTTTA